MDRWVWRLSRENITWKLHSGKFHVPRWEIKMKSVGCRGVSWGSVLSFLQVGKAPDLWFLLKNIPSDACKRCLRMYMDCAANMSRTDGQWHLNVLGQCVHGELGLYSGSPVSRTCITNQPWILVGTSHKRCWKGWVCDEASLMGQGHSLKQKVKWFHLEWAIHVRIFMHLDISKDLEEDLKFTCWWSQLILP